MPVMLEPDDWPVWLGEVAGHYAALLRPAPAGTVRLWPVSRIVCTLKFQGETDHATTRAFVAIPGARLLHLFHNKHELTFLWQRAA